MIYIFLLTAYFVPGIYILNNAIINDDQQWISNGVIHLTIGLFFLVVFAMKKKEWLAEKVRDYL